MRTTYKNGQELDSATGCDGCQVVTIQGVLCHETGCPNAWRDREVECRLCGDRFYPEGGRQDSCFDCLNDGCDDEERDDDGDDEERDDDGDDEERDDDGDD